MNDTTLYVPFLKGKRGEFRALFDLFDDDAALITPVIEVPAISQFVPRTMDEHLEKIAGYANAFWGARGPIYFDFRLVLEGSSLTAANLDGYVAEFLRHLHAKHIHAGLSAPLFALGGMPQSIERAASVGLIARATEKDFAFLDLLKPAVERLRPRLGQTHLALDLGTLSPDKAAMLRFAAPGMLMAVPSLDQMASVIVLGGSIAEEHAPQFGVQNSVPRYEKALWTQVRNILGPPKGTLRVVAADYGISLRKLADGDPKLMRASPRLTYTTEDTYELIKERKAADGSFQSFRTICNTIVGAPYFRGSRFSAGDDFIFSCHLGLTKTGTPEMWIRHGTNHHMTLVARELAGRLDAPPAR